MDLECEALPPVYCGTFWIKEITVDNYMNSLVKRIYEKNGNITNEELETLDKKVCRVGDHYVRHFCER